MTRIAEATQHRHSLKNGGKLLFSEAGREYESTGENNISLLPEKRQHSAENRENHFFSSENYICIELCSVSL